MTAEADTAQTTTELCYTRQFLNTSMFTASSLQDVSSIKGVIASKRASQRREHHTAGCTAYAGRGSLQAVAAGPTTTAATRNVSIEILMELISKIRPDGRTDIPVPAVQHMTDLRST